MQSPVDSDSDDSSSSCENDWQADIGGIAATGKDSSTVLDMFDAMKKAEPKRTKEGYRIISLDTTDSSFYSTIRGQINDKVYNKFTDLMDECDPEEDIAIDIHSSGGDMFYTIMIANAVSEHRGKTVARISRVAMSGATVIVLACDEIIMAPTACLGPIDLQMWLPVKCALPALEQYKDKNALCGVLHNVFEVYTNDYLLKLQDVLAELYSEEEMDELLEYFYHQHEHQTPLFPRNILEAVPFLKLTTDPELKYERPTKAAAKPDMLSTMLGL
jgi:hypothetical protein